MTTLSDYLAMIGQAPNPNASPASQPPPAQGAQPPNPASPAPVMPGAAQQPSAQPPQSYSDFYARLMNAAAANEKANPTNLGSWISGTGRDAALARVAAVAPGMWQQYKATQDALQRSQLGTMQAYAEPQAMTGVPISPNNPMASLPDYSTALRSLFTANNGQGQAQPAPGSVATNAAPENAIAHMDGLFGGQPVNPAIVARYESNNNSNAISPKGATGTMQVMPATAADPGFGVAPAADSSNGATAQTGANYLAAMQARYKSPTLGLIAYNWGPGNTDKWLASGADLTQLPQETRDYVGNIVHAQTGGVMPQPGQARAAPADPASAAPASAANDPTAPYRAFYLRMSQMRGMMGDTSGAKQFFDMANAGRPDNAIVSPNGNFTEPTITSSNGPEPARTYAAEGAGMTSAAQAHGTATQTPVQVVGRNGPMTVSQADMLKNGGSGETGPDGQPNWLPADSPQYKAIQGAQQKEIGDLRGDATLANTGLVTAQQLYNAANGLYTGKGAEVAQGIRKTLQAVAQLTNTPVPQAITQSTSQFEQLKYAALNFVQSAAHGFSPRAAQQIVKMIQAAKPGDTTSPQGLKAIIENEIVPAYTRTRAMYGATGQYYQQHPLATDAQSIIPDQMPISNFGVKHFPQQVNPGDFYVSRHDGSLQQRIAQ